MVSGFHFFKASSQNCGSLCHDFPRGADSKESVCNVGDLGSIPGFGRSPGGHGKPLQYSCLENLHGQREAWQATAHGLAKSRT